MFPALKEAWRELRSGFGSERISLELEQKESGVPLGFNPGDVEWYARNGFRSIYDALSGGMSSWSGESVNLDTALNHSVVWACNRLICGTLGFMPLAMMQEQSGGKFPASKHPMWRALHNAPNAEMTAMRFRETLTSHYLLGGNAYAQIYRRSGTGVANELDLLLPKQVTPDRDKSGSLIYVVKRGSEVGKTYTVQSGKPQDILHIPGIGYDGIRGYSVLEKGRHSIGTAIATERYTGMFYKMGARAPYVLERTQRFKTTQEEEQFIKDWNAAQAQYHKAQIMYPGMVYKPIGSTLREAQFNESRLYEIHELCRWFGVSPHMVGDLSRATFSNIEELALHFVKVTLTEHLTRWEQELWRCILTPDEQNQGYYFRHNVNGLLRGDFLTRMQGYAIMTQNAIANPNQLRDLEDWNPYDGGDEYHYQLNMQPAGPGSPGSTPVKPGAAVDSISNDPEG